MTPFDSKSFGNFISVELERMDKTLHEDFTWSTWPRTSISCGFEVKDDINILLKMFEGRTNVNEILMRRVLQLRHKCKSDQQFYYKLKQMKYFKGKLK